MLGKTVAGLLLVALVVPPAVSASERGEAILSEHKEEITTAAKAFGLSPRLLASVIYAERSLNVKPGEDIVDAVLARTGYNSSVGLAQVKVNTALWIEGELCSMQNPLSVALPGVRQISRSSSRGELIDRLEDPQMNALYAAAYLALIERRWRDVLMEPYSAAGPVGILATVYSLGILLPDGGLRVPRRNAQMNRFGEIAQEFYDSFRLRSEFPE